MKALIKKWLGINEIDNSLTSRVECIEELILHKESRYMGFAVLKRHLNRPDKPLPNFGGKPIEQD